MELVEKYYLHIMQESIKPLKVLSASAGSGKTFSLVQSYLDLTIGKSAGSKDFAKIIAMTFTNKAAWEMKARIIEALDLLAFPDRRTEKETKKALNLLKATKRNIDLSEDEIRRNSKRALSQILHNYEDFHVMTIDKFSLRLIRTFSRDLDLSDDFEIILDQKELLEQVVDEMLSKIGKPGEEEVTKLALDYAKSNLEEGDKWNFRSSLIDFAKVLTVENDQEYIEELLKKTFTSEEYEELKADLKKVNQEYIQKAMELYKYFMNLNSVPEDYPGKSRGLFGWLEGLRGSDLYEYKPMGLTAQKTLSGENVKSDHKIDAGLIAKVEEFLNLEAKAVDRFYLLSKLRKNFYNLSLLKHIAVELNSFKERHNVIGIYEFSRKISELLKKEIAPYIYERLGTRFQNYLLDEFQDTSRLQWLNLIPLIHDSIAGGNKNLIVGDPKQAIYRFRNGLVEQFVALPKIYNPEKDAELTFTSQYFDEMGVKAPLEENYRSRKNIVNFNNTFFEKMLGRLPESFGNYYEDIHQNPMGAEGGYVTFELYDGEDKSEESSIREAFLLKSVRKSLSDGFKRGDICILTKTRKEGNQWAKVLSRAEEQFNIVSADSLSVSSDKTVRFFIDYFELRKNSGNHTLQTKFASSYFQIKSQDPLIALNDYWGKRIGDLDFQKFVDETFGSLETLFMDFENMYDLGQKFSKIVGVNELRNPYLHHFMEILQNYDLRFGPDLRGFLEHWDAKASRETVQMPENDEAIKIMTIHKSKGLEFPVVILPGLEWEIKPSRSQQFVKSDNNEIIYSSLSKKDVPEYMARAYDREYEQELLDAFNLLYVALTRAESRIYGLLDENQSAKKSGGEEYYTLLSQPIIQGLEAIPSEFFTRKDDVGYILGEEILTGSTEATQESGFIPTDISDFLWFPEMSLKDKDALEKEDLSDEQRFGNQLHLVLSEVNKEEKLDEVIAELSKKDAIEKSFVKEIRNVAKSILSLEEYLSLMQNADKILSEQDILLDEKTMQRPDKLFIKDKSAFVVDFKTGKALKKHETQIRNYLTALKAMGFQRVEGYLLYTTEVNMVKVL